jgi:hypothetical protein
MGQLSWPVKKAESRIPTALTCLFILVTKLIRETTQD